MKKLSILIYSMGLGGAEKSLSLLLPYFEKEFEVFLVLMNETIEFQVPKNIKVIFLEKSLPFENGIKKLIKIPYLSFKYAKFCQKNNIDISLSFMVRPNYINSLSKKFGNRSKIIISEHSYPSYQYQNNNLQSKINKILIKYLYKFSDEIVAVSKAVKNDLEKNFALKNVKVIYNPISKEEIIKKSKERVDDFNFDTYTYITVGRLDDGKNHEFMIKEFSKLKNNSKLIIIGEGVLKNYLQNLIKELNLENRVFLLGEKKNPYKYMLNSDCFLFTSKFESFGIVLIEAMVLNIPIISTNFGQVTQEILGNNGTENFYLSLKNCDKQNINYDISKFEIDYIVELYFNFFNTCQITKIIITQFQDRKEGA